MKNLRSLSTLPLCMILAACSNNDKNISSASVPPAVIFALSNKYPGASNATWELEMDGADTVYEATFTHEGKKMDAEFDRNGNPAESD